MIDVSYNYQHSFSDPRSGTHSRTVMKVTKNDNTKFAIDEGDDDPFLFGNYSTTWPSKTTYNNVLKVAVNDVNVFIYRSNSGLHDDPQGTWHYKSAVLIIDPSTGKVIDLMKPNYFYDNFYKHYSSFGPER